MAGKCAAHAPPAHQAENEPQLASTSQRQAVAAAEDTRDLKGLALRAPPALGENDRRVEAFAAQQVRACREPRPHRRVLRSAPPGFFDSQLERVDDGGLIEGRADLCQRRVDRARASRAGRRAGATRTLEIEPAARPPRHGIVRCCERRLHAARRTRRPQRGGAFSYPKRGHLSMCVTKSAPYGDAGRDYGHVMRVMIRIAKTGRGSVARAAARCPRSRTA